MEIIDIEKAIISCIKKNLDSSEEDVPEITSRTEVFNAIPNFDSLRALEVLVDLEEIVHKDLTIESVFVKQPPGTDRVCDIAVEIKKLVDKL
jgi:acyl carrier protein